MSTIRFFLLAILLAISLFVVGCTSTADSSDAYKGETYEEIFQKGEKAMKNHSYKEAIKRFEALDIQYPFNRKTQIAQLHIIYAYHMSDEYALAESAADRFIHAHPGNPHVDYAYYMRGLSNYFQNLGVFERIFAVDLATRDLSQIKKSYEDFETLVKKFPNSKYAPAAYQYMIYLKNVLAKHELRVAKYYYDRSAYIAAANRATNVVRGFQGTPCVPDALVIMYKSYKKLHLKKNKNEVMSLLQYNYPNSKYIKDAQDELYKR
ncbi:outer membrane protein assembly factor BamD [Gammaproteobacteria bacterium]|nr:outer membrane protein assembly factor BamD [Gammaproteobacteria bacterium]